MGWRGKNGNYTGMSENRALRCVSHCYRSVCDFSLILCLYFVCVFSALFGWFFPRRFCFSCRGEKCVKTSGLQTRKAVKYEKYVCALATPMTYYERDKKLKKAHRILFRKCTYKRTKYFFINCNI